MVKLASLLTPAKINLFLRVTGRRADGYHEIDSVFVPVTIFDRVTLEMRPGARGVTLRIDTSSVPQDDRNIAFRSAAKFLEQYGIEAAVRIDIRKTIPIGAGLGGGSSDAGAVLRIMSSLARVPGDEGLHALALSLGADVPFFLAPGPNRVRGIGEQLAPAPIPELNCVIVVPPFEVLTARVYAALKQKSWSGPAPDGDLASLAAGEVSASIFVNDLAAAAVGMHPRIGELLGLMLELGAKGAAMSGSGAAVFGLFGSAAEASKAASEVSRRAPEVQVFNARSLNA
jgi:4-diphosphocytidyl-2-C-methyl-D-erythritol kinase